MLYSNVNDGVRGVRNGAGGVTCVVDGVSDGGILSVSDGDVVHPVLAMVVLMMM